MKFIDRDPKDGSGVSFRTRRGAYVFRPQYTYKGQTSYASRFYFKKMVAGHLKLFPLSPDPKEAEIQADKIAGFFFDPNATIEEAWKKFNPLAQQRPGLHSTFRELFDIHSKSWGILDVSPKTGVGYQGAMLVVLRQAEAYRKNEDPDKLMWAGKRGEAAEKLKAPWLEMSLSVLTESLALNYQRAMVPPTIEDEEELITQKISCDSNLRCARALFSQEAMKLYRINETLVLPDIAGFMSVSLFHAKKYFELPSPDVVRKIFTAAPELKAQDLNAYRAFLLCVQCGLRKSEATNFRMDWMREEDAPTILIREDGKYAPKHGHGRKVFLDAWVGAEVKEIAAGDAYLDGTKTEREVEVFERLNGFLRKQGIDASKPTHELRKLWFSAKTKRDGIYAAAKQGGHRDVKITQSFYADSSLPDNLIPFWTEPTLAALAKIKTA